MKNDSAILIILVIILANLVIINNKLFFGDNFGAVRGGARTGFYLLADEQIGMGTSTLTYDFTIVSHSTSTIYLAKDKTATTTGGCLVIDDYDKSGSTYCIYADGVQTCSSTDICL